MNLEILLHRAQEIETAILNMTGQLNVLHGHKAETAHWVEKLKAAEDETKVDSLPEVPVE